MGYFYNFIKGLIIKPIRYCTQYGFNIWTPAFIGVTELR